MSRNAGKGRVQSAFCWAKAGLPSATVNAASASARMNMRGNIHLARLRIARCIAILCWPAARARGLASLAGLGHRWDNLDVSQEFTMSAPSQQLDDLYRRFAEGGFDRREFMRQAARLGFAGAAAAALPSLAGPAEAAQVAQASAAGAGTKIAL